MLSHFVFSINHNNINEFAIGVNFFSAKLGEKWHSLFMARYVGLYLLI